MSTKIYEAYRIKEGADAEQVLGELYNTARETVDNYIKDLCIAMLDDKTPHKFRENYLKRCAESRWKSWPPTPADANDFMKEVRDKATPEVRNSMVGDFYFIFDASLAVWLYEGSWYLIPYSNMTVNLATNKRMNVWEFLESHPFLEDYSYWNNTDMPEEVSEQEWDERRAVWDGIDSRGWFNRFDMRIWEEGLDYMFGPYLDTNPESKHRVQYKEWLRTNRKKVKRRNVTGASKRRGK